MNFDWKKPGAIETLRTMWLAGEKASDIARAIGYSVSPGAVIYKARRLGLGHHPNPRHKLTPEEARKRRRLREKKDRSLGEGQLSRGQIERVAKRPTTYEQAFPLGEPNTDDWAVTHRYLSNERN
jgi:hypothetical protein